MRVTKVETDSGNGEDIVAGGPLHIRFVVDTERASDTRITLGLSDGAPKPFLTLSGGVHLGAGQTELSCHVPSLPVAGGRYFLWMNADSDDEPAGEWHPITAFDVTGPAPPPLPRAVVRIAPVVCESRWEVSS